MHLCRGGCQRLVDRGLKPQKVIQEVQKEQETVWKISNNYEYKNGKWQRRNTANLDDLCWMQRSRQNVFRKMCIQGTFWRYLSQGFSGQQAEFEALHSQLICMGREPSEVQWVKLGGQHGYVRPSIFFETVH